MPILPYGRQSINNKDIAAVLKVLKSAWMTQGPKVDEFERALASYCGARYAVAVSSGTAALHLACLVAKLEKKEAITSPITFLATSNAVLYAGGKPVFADIDPQTVTLDVNALKKKITKKTKAILPVHFAGYPCDMPAISKIAKKHKLIVIEDAAHALGAVYQDKGRRYKVGSCAHSDMAIFSFHPVKHITTGEGGAITTNNPKIYNQLKALRAHGVYKDQKTKKQGPWYYEMRELGFNYRITDFQCALGISQLKRNNQFLKKRQEIAKAYNKAFKSLKGVSTFDYPKLKNCAFHLYMIKINYRALKTKRAVVMKKLMNLGVGTQVHYIPVYKQPIYKKLGVRQKNCPEAERYYEQALSLPMYPDLGRKSIQRVIKAVKKVLKV